MVNSINVCIKDEQGVEQEFVITAIHDDPNGYGFEYSNNYNVSIIGDDGDGETDLGKFYFSDEKKHWVYDRADLSIFQQEQIAEVIRNYKESNFDDNW